MTATELKKRAIALAEKTKIDSVTPEEVGQLSNDIVEYIENVEINGSSLGIRKTYTSVSAMEADSTAPKDDKGVLLRRGMLVNIYNQSEPDSADNGKVFSFQNPGWAFRGTIDAGYATRDEVTELGNKTDNLAETIIKHGTTTSENIIDFISENGAVLFYIDKDGYFNCVIKQEKGTSRTIPVSQKFITDIVNQLEEVINSINDKLPNTFPKIVTLEDDNREDRLFEQVSENGNVLFYIDKDGFFNCKNKFTDDVPFIFDNLYPSKADYDNETIVHLITYGQSLSIGIGDNNVYEMLPNNSALMFSVLGLRDLGVLGINQDDYNRSPEIYDNEVYKFRKYKEIFYESSDSWSEGLLVNATNPSSGICDALIRRYNKKRKDIPYKILFSPIGSGGANIELFLKSGTSDNRNYTALIKAIQKAKEATERKGYKYRFGGIFWIQGETNEFTREEYKEKLKQLMSDVNTDVKDITGQSEDINWFGYQSTNGSGGVLNSILAQYDVFSDKSLKPRYIMCAPSYPFKKSDDLHLGDEHYILFGNTLGMRFYDLIHNGNIDYIKPFNVLVFENYIEIEFNKPYLIDSEHVYDRTNVVVDDTCGFYLMKDGVNQVINCEVIDSYRIKINCTDVSDISKFYYGTDGTTVKGGIIRENYKDTGWNDIPVLFYMPIQEIKINNLLDIKD